MDANKWMPKNGCQKMDAQNMDAKKWMPNTWMPTNGCQQMDAKKSFYRSFTSTSMRQKFFDAIFWHPNLLASILWHPWMPKSASALLRRHLLASIFWHPFFDSLPLAHSWGALPPRPPNIAGGRCPPDPPPGGLAPWTPLNIVCSIYTETN